jgi:hypothetical protein
LFVFLTARFVVAFVFILFWFSLLTVCFVNVSCVFRFCLLSVLRTLALPLVLLFLDWLLSCSNSFYYYFVHLLFFLFKAVVEAVAEVACHSALRSGFGFPGGCESPSLYKRLATQAHPPLGSRGTWNNSDTFSQFPAQVVVKVGSLKCCRCFTDMDEAILFFSAFDDCFLTYQGQLISVGDLGDGDVVHVMRRIHDGLMPFYLYEPVPLLRNLNKALLICKLDVVGLARFWSKFDIADENSCLT